MKLSELIKQAQELLVKEGDLDCLSEETYELTSMQLEEAGEGYPDTWGMPEGYRFIRVKDAR